jgi:hypothetical protein
MKIERGVWINGSQSSDLMAVPAFIVSVRSSLQLIVALHLFGLCNFDQ